MLAAVRCIAPSEARPIAPSDALMRLRLLREQLCALAAGAEDAGEAVEASLRQIAAAYAQYQTSLADELAALEGRRFGGMMRAHVLQSCAAQRAAFERLVTLGCDARSLRSRRRAAIAAARAMEIELNDLAQDAACARRALRARAGLPAGGLR